MAALLLSTVAAGIFLHLSDGKRIKELESQMSQMRKQDRKSVMDRRVSKQMEEIAYGQQLLSEERSQEAIRQSEIAQAATLRSEAERQRAVQAQVRAEASALEAKQSYEMAEQQRMEANEQRQQAVSAKLTADTLNYISLGRTLGLQSYTIYRTGDTEIGNMLAYTAYRFTHDYGGDIYVPAVFQSMMQSAGARQSWSVHDGRITGTDFFPNGKSLLTVSTLGEMFLNEIRNGQLTTRRLFANKAFSFRDAFASRSGKSYAVSQTGHLVIAGTGQPEVIRLERLTRPFRLEIMGNGKELLIIGEHNVALLDLTTDKITTTRQLDFNVVCGTRRNNSPLLFDDKGRMHLVRSLDNMTDERVPVSEKVTCFASSDNGMAAYGTADGTIYLIDRRGRTHRLVGHLSQVTKLKFYGQRLYSSGNDKKLLLWMTGENQIRPITLLLTNSWLTDFTFDDEKNFIWSGEANGTITQYLISLPLISERLRKNVKRNFTPDEWDYYVGKGIPYKKVKGNSE